MRMILVLVCWLSIEIGYAQSSTNNFFDAPVLTETSVGKARIGMSAAELRALYKGCTFSSVQLAQYGFDDYGGKPAGVLVSIDKQKLFVYFLDWATKKKVAGLLVLHPSYKTAQGIHVGSTAGQLKTALPTVRVVPNEMVGSMDIAFAGSINKPGLEYIFFKQGDIGDYAVADEPAKITATAAKVSWIQLYPRL